MPDVSARLDLWIQRLKAIAQTGLAFDPSPYDTERYEEILGLASEMAATRDTSEPDAELSAELFNRWRAQVKPRVEGYVTPKVGVGAVVFNERDELLLIERPSRRWLYPTGWADVGYSPAQIAAKEVLEETGLRVTPQRLIAVYDIRYLQEEEIDLQFYSLVFYCRLDGGEIKIRAHEALQAGFYAYDHLPQPIARADQQWIQHAWAAHRGELKQTYFDPI